MKGKYRFVVCLLFILLVISGIGTGWYLRYEDQGKETEEKQIVVTSFYPMYVASMNILVGCREIELKSLSEPQGGCLHDYQLTPEDMKLLAEADVFVVNGGGIESFLSQVAEAYPKLKIVNASNGIPLLEENPHVWTDPDNYQVQIKNIMEGLNLAFPNREEVFRANMQQYQNKIEKVCQKMDNLKENTKEKNVILFHEAYRYLAKACGMNVTYVMDLDEERQVSAGEVADVVKAVNENGVSCILAEEQYGKSLGDTVSRETEVKMLYLNPLIRGAYEADSYIKGMEENIRILEGAFQ